jgi:hypothetical protein
MNLAAGEKSTNDYEAYIKDYESYIKPIKLKQNDLKSRLKAIFQIYSIKLLEAARKT